MTIIDSWYVTGNILQKVSEDCILRPFVFYFWEARMSSAGFCALRILLEALVTGPVKRTVGASHLCNINPKLHIATERCNIDGRKSAELTTIRQIFLAPNNLVRTKGTVAVWHPTEFIEIVYFLYIFGIDKFFSVSTTLLKELLKRDKGTGAFSLD